MPALIPVPSVPGQPGGEAPVGRRPEPGVAPQLEDVDTGPVPDVRGDRRDGRRRTAVVDHEHAAHLGLGKEPVDGPDARGGLVPVDQDDRYRGCCHVGEAMAPRTSVRTRRIRPPERSSVRGPDQCVLHQFEQGGLGRFPLSWRR